ncbi:MAG TPA: type II toxin-antitoxin system MqsA family antitoxin [Pyrinomonadaceae bacterium]|nr:type II toxin-antitoxin system MqsA family antitoxin [Pyrinomonadaceae bacterium]
MECMYCKGKMKRGTAPFHIDRKGYHLVFDSVPAFVCEQCGEVYFDEPEVDSMQEAIRAVDAQAAKILVAA